MSNKINLKHADYLVVRDALDVLRDHLSERHYDVILALLAEGELKLKSYTLTAKDERAEFLKRVHEDFASRSDDHKTCECNEDDEGKPW